MSEGQLRSLRILAPKNCVLISNLFNVTKLSLCPLNTITDLEPSRKSYALVEGLVKKGYARVLQSISINIENCQKKYCIAYLALYVH